MTALGLAGCGGSSAPKNSDAQPARDHASATDQCRPEAQLMYICGFRGPEDIVPLGDTKWLVVSGVFPLDGHTPGRIYLVDRSTKTMTALFPADGAIVRQDTAMFGTCPGPPDLPSFRAHGLALREVSSASFRVYATAHGAREAIEVFEIHTSEGPRPSIAWVGCVLLPPGLSSNGVAILSDGGFVTTKWAESNSDHDFEKILAGTITGAVYEWHPGGLVAAIPGTELSGANGIELSPDQRWMYVAEFGARRVVQFDRQSRPPARRFIALEIAPDNLRWSSDGMLDAAGDDHVVGCTSPPCAGWSVVEIDPKTLLASRIAGAGRDAALQGASTALRIGSEIWIGTFSGDRIGYFRRP